MDNPQPSRWARMRRRRREGSVFCSFEVQSDAIAILVQRGLLTERQRYDKAAVTRAVAALLNASLGFDDDPTTTEKQAHG
jgi:hypothetical protein